MSQLLKVLATKSGNLNLVSRVHRVEREYQLLRVSYPFTATNVAYMCVNTTIYTHK